MDEATEVVIKLISRASNGEYTLSWTENRFSAEELEEIIDTAIEEAAVDKLMAVED